MSLAAKKRDLLESVSRLVRANGEDASAKALDGTLNAMTALVGEMFEKPPGKTWIVALTEVPDGPGLKEILAQECSPSPDGASRF